MTNKLNEHLKAHNEAGIPFITRRRNIDCTCGHACGEHSQIDTKCYEDDCPCNAYVPEIPPCPGCGDESSLRWIARGHFVECSNTDCCWSFSTTDANLIRTTVRAAAGVTK